MKGVLPVRSWLLLAVIAVASLIAGLVQLRQSPFGAFSGERMSAMLSGQALDPRFSQWVVGYSGGVRSVKEPIVIAFAEPVDSQARQAALAEPILQIRPQLEGTLFWRDAQTLVFRPDTLLPYDTPFLVELALDKLFNIQTKALKTFAFALTTEALQARFKGVGFSPDGGLLATLQTSDYVPARLVEQAVQAIGMPAPDRWTHSQDGTLHTLHLPDPRTGKVVSASLQADLALLGGKGNIARLLSLPPKGTFTLFDVEEAQGPDHSLVLHFTQPLQPDQNLQGLIFLQNMATGQALAEGCSATLPLPADAYGAQSLLVAAGLAAASGQTLQQDLHVPVTLRPALPGLRMPGSGYIVPAQGSRSMLSFEARALRQATLRIYRIFPANIPAFLAQTDPRTTFNGFYQRTIGRPVGKLMVNLPADAQPADYTRYQVDITRFVADAPTALHFVQLSFTPAQMRYRCEEAPDAAGGLTSVPDQLPTPEPGFDDDNESYGYGDWTGQSSYTYDEEGNYYPSTAPAPCLESYAYSDLEGLEGGRTQVGTYLLRSNLALQGRVGPRQVHIIATDLATAKPSAGVKIQLLGKQHQVIAQATSDADGLALFEDLPERPTPILALAEAKGSVAYLNLKPGRDLTLTPFAKELAKGQATSPATASPLKAFIYTERGTYRPGDTLHVGMILQGASAALLLAPVVLEVTNSRGASIYRRAKAETLGQHYRWNIPTEPSAPTGGYQIVATVAGQSFYHNVSVETIRPNRMALAVKFSQASFLAGQAATAHLSARYLYGSPAANLKVAVAGQAAYTDFAPAQFADFAFRNTLRPASSLPPTAISINTQTDASGLAQLEFTPPAFAPEAPVRLTLTTKVFEQGGQFSQQFSQTTVHPAKAYIGLKQDAAPAAGSYDLAGQIKLSVVRVAPLTEQLQPSVQPLKYKLTRLDWVWWYQDVQGADVFAGSGHVQVVKQGTLPITQGKAQFDFKVEKWGRYALEVQDPSTGHSASQIFYVGYPDDGSSDTDPARHLLLAADKPTYEPGSAVLLNLPQGQAYTDTRALVSLEAGNQTLAHHWAHIEGNQIKITLPAQAPRDVYAHITLLRPYDKVAVGQPLRSYGLLHLEVADKTLALKPAIKAPAEGKPGQELQVHVSEAQGRPMTYVLAMVDEGLLYLTNFRTPDPATVLNGRQPLAIASFDNFDDVLTSGYLGGTPILATGGDAFVKAAALKEEARNNLAVDAVSRVLGPFTLAEGQQALHKLTAPAYPGAIRWMLIANTPTAAASAEAITRIRADLILEATLPRLASVGDKFMLPIEVESFLPKQVQASITARIVSGPAAWVGSPTARLSLAPKAGRKRIDLQLQAGTMPGLAVIEITAQGAGAQARRIFRLPVRAANRPIRKVTDFLLAQGQRSNWPPPAGKGLAGPASVEVSALPALGLADKLDYLVQYPYGCLEQNVSAALAQLYLPQLMALSKPTAAVAASNVLVAQKQLQNFALSSGLLSLWPKEGAPDVAASAYACWFLQEADRLGYGSSPLLPRLQGALSQQARSAAGAIKPAEQINLAFVLFCLGRHAAEADLNRLAQKPRLPRQAQIWLAGAYMRRGQLAQAQARLQPPVPDAPPYEADYDSPLRTQAILAWIDVQLQPKGKPSGAALALANQVRTSPYLSTQELGWAFAALSLLPQGQGQASVSIGGQQQAVTSKAVLVNVAAGRPLPTVANEGKAPVYLRLTQTYTPGPGQEAATANGLQVTVKYVDALQKPVDPALLRQGQAFEALITVRNTSGQPLDRLALSYPIPAGWEIENDRLAAGATSQSSIQLPGLDYEDIRDDRVHRFFSLAAGKQITFRTRLTAAYRGTFAKPAIVAEAMYLPQFQAIAKGGVVQVR